MKNRGFTLIELLAVIAILGSIGTFITISFMNSLKSQRQIECDAFVKEVEDAACVYVGLHNKKIECTREKCDPISLKFLQEEALIKSEIDACTGKDIDITKSVVVEWNASGERQCKYNGVRKYER